MKSLLPLLLIITGFALSVPVELLQNGDFETGVLTPWITNNWIISTTDPHSGTYSAFVEGNHSIRQNFTPADVSKVVSVIFWHKQPEVALFGIEFWYGPADHDFEVLTPSGPEWLEYDLTYLLRTTGNLEAICIWGYSGGGGAPDYNYFDDASIIYDDEVPLDRTTFGAIKAMFSTD